MTDEKDTKKMEKKIETAEEKAKVRDEKAIVDSEDKGSPDSTEEVKGELASSSDHSNDADLKKAKPKDEKTGIAYIRSSQNNTIVHITDLAGHTISRITGGMVTKHSRLKANPTIAMFVAKRAAERALDLGFTKLYVRMKGRTGYGNGPGSHAAVKSLGKAGFTIISMLDTTKVPRGGPKKSGGRRGRRV